MSDLISRQAVLDYPIRLDHYDEEHGNRHFVLGIESVMEYVEYLPSADAVKVVRCKNCEYGQYDCTHMYCDYFCHKVYETDYCNNAVRRSNAVKRREP